MLSKNFIRGRFVFYIRKENIIVSGNVFFFKVTEKLFSSDCDMYDAGWKEVYPTYLLCPFGKISCSGFGFFCFYMEIKNLLIYIIYLISLYNLSDTFVPY